ncbi:MAG: phospholipase A [Colwellia sp.]|nr:phospholipase A [Colwellia sp.]MCW8863290.1 phospholipase A [Colwellia sp.]MCW9081273.1 phospholipase A [Colwellia sp.]
MNIYKKNNSIVKYVYSVLVLFIFPQISNATTDNELQIEKCITAKLKTVPKTTTVEEIQNLCNKQLKKTKNQGVISNRILSERENIYNPYVITPHKLNYILPVTYTNDINTDAYGEVGNWPDNLEDIEAKFQLSIKVPLNYSSLFIEGDKFFFGFTIESWWQLYSDNISKPFRETNYQPEFFYMAPLDWHPFEGNTGFTVGVEHQSNGRSVLLSRSWNRVYFNFLFEKNNFALSFKPWFRIPEDEKRTEMGVIVASDEGDDNPDIDDYMGNFELGLLYKWHDYEIAIKGRENFAEHKGAIEIGFTFPLWGNLRGYAQYFDGYGESLIDYDHNQRRFGIGIALTDIL